MAVFFNSSDNIFSQMLCLNNSKLGVTLGTEVSDISKSFFYDIQDGRKAAIIKFFKQNTPPSLPANLHQP